jgi:hypothetical protein
MSKYKENDPIAPVMAQVLSVDIRAERYFSELPSELVVVMASRPGEMGMDTRSGLGGQPRGVFSYHFEQALRRVADAKKKVKVPSLHQSIIEAAGKMLKKYAQCPVVAGNCRDWSMLREYKLPSGQSAHKRCVALLVGINKYGMGSNLSGCVNDVHAFRNLLEEYPRTFGLALVDVVADGKATRAQVIQRLQKVVASTRSDDLFVFQFSGHLSSRVREPGPSRNVRDVLVAHDYDNKGKGELSVAEICQIVSGAKAKRKLLVIDG